MLKWNNGQKKTEGEYRNDQKEGKWTEWYKPGITIEGEYRKGREEGKWEAWHENGQKAAEVEYRDDAEVSRIEWDTNGNLIQPPQPQPSPSPIT